MNRRVNTNKVSNNISSESGYYDEDPRLSLNSRSNSGPSMIRNNHINIAQLNGNANAQMSDVVLYNQYSDHRRNVENEYCSDDENSGEQEIEEEFNQIVTEEEDEVEPDNNEEDDCQYVPGDDAEYVEDEYVEEEEDTQFEEVVEEDDTGDHEEAIDLTNDDSNEYDNDANHAHRTRHNAQDQEQESDEDDDVMEVREYRVHDDEIIELSTINTQSKIFYYFYFCFHSKIKNSQHTWLHTRKSRLMTSNF